MCAHATFIAFCRTTGIGCVPMQNSLLLAQLKALGVCPCKIYDLWHNGRHWVCAHATFIAFGRTEGIGCVPMQKLLLLAELKALGVCPCKIYYFWQNQRHWVSTEFQPPPTPPPEISGRFRPTSPICSAVLLGFWILPICSADLRGFCEFADSFCRHKVSGSLCAFIFFRQALSVQ